MKVKAKGYWNGNDYDINLSSIYTELIKQAAKCKSYSSDILIDIDNINKCLCEKKSNEKIIKLFGFRDYGVDHKSYVRCRFDANNLEETYRTLYKMTLDFKDNVLEVTLEKCPSKKSMRKFVEGEF